MHLLRTESHASSKWEGNWVGQLRRQEKGVGCAAFRMLRIPHIQIEQQQAEARPERTVLFALQLEREFSAIRRHDRIGCAVAAVPRKESHTLEIAGAVQREPPDVELAGEELESTIAFDQDRFA